MTATPGVQRLGPAIVLQGAALVEVMGLVALGIRERSRRNGVNASPRLTNLLGEMGEAASWAMSSGHADVPKTPVLAGSDSVEIPTEEAAAMLALSDRQVRRLASTLGARKVHGALVWDRGAVAAYAAERQETQR